MLTPTLAAIILLVVCALLLIVIPILDGSSKFARYISLRYTLVSVALIMALGCVLDFSHLAESSRNIVLMGGLILVGVFVGVRSIEKLKLGGKKLNVSFERGDIKVGATIYGGECTSDEHMKSNEQDNKSQDEISISSNIDNDSSDNKNKE